MAQTKNSALNTFEQGLVMDFAPERAGDKTLSNALNATFLTFNGNEWSLQNDMGNARVETAFLPTGYVPVGTCEFGDIIYIVSYNPLENKSLIGCFPSPERNISNKERGGLNQSIDSNEFIEDGKIKAATVRKIVYSGSNINPGDKFIVSWGPLGSENVDTISNYGNTTKILDNVKAYWPKLLLVHVVSIEETGKITYLDSTVKWYPDSKNKEFIVSDKTLSNETTASNLDTYRSALSCLYSVFQSKIPGKLALYFELESINNFSCGHKVFKYAKSDRDNTDKYDVYLSASWETDNYNVNPCGMLIVDTLYNLVWPADNTDNIFYTDEVTPGTNLYKAERVIEFTRLYSLESPSSNYKTFINNDSYYAQIGNYQYINDGKGNSAIATSVLREYEFNKEFNARVPKKEDSASKRASYFINPVGMKIKADKNYEYTTIINGKEVKCTATLIPDDVIVNYFKKSVLKKVATVYPSTAISNDDPDTHTILYTVAPCMPYGVLDSLATTNTIYFNKAETGEVKLNRWQYFVNTTSMTLRFGFDTYLKTSENEVIDKILIEFYDNTGICATYILTGQETYDATFTEYFKLDKASSNARMTTKRVLNNSRELTSQIPHTSSNTSILYNDLVTGNYNLDNYYTIINENCKLCSELSDSEKSTNPKAYLSNAGILYYGRPYGARIKIFKGTETELGTIDPSGKETPIVFDRWIWTSPIFNENFSTVNDFKTCQPSFTFDYALLLDGRNIKVTTDKIYPDKYTEKTSSTFKLLRLQIESTETNLTLKGGAAIANTYGNTFQLDYKQDSAIKMRIALNDPHITFDKDSFTTEYEESYIKDLEDLHPACTKNAYPDLATKDATDNIYDSYTNLKYWRDCFSLLFTDVSKLSQTSYSFSYLDENNETKTAKVNYVETNSSALRKDSLGFILLGAKFNKSQAASVKKSYIKNFLKKLIETHTDLENILGIYWDSNAGRYFHGVVGYLGMSTGTGDRPTVERNRIFCTGYISKTPKIDISDSGSSDDDDGVFAVRNDDVEFDFNKEEHIKYLSELGYLPIMPIVFGEASNDNGDDDEGVHGMWASRSLEGFSKYMYRQKPNDSNRISNDKNFIYPQKYEEEVSTGKTECYHKLLGRTDNVNVPVVLGLKDDSTGSYVVGADLRFYYADGTNFYQNFPWRQDKRPSTGQSTAYVYNYASLLASIFLPLYVSGPCMMENGNTLYIPENIATCGEYTEYWIEDIIVNMRADEAYTKNTSNFNPKNSSSVLLTILPNLTLSFNSTEYKGINLFWYAAAVLKYMYPENKTLANLDTWNKNGGFLDLSDEAKKPNVAEVLTFTNINPIFLETSKAIIFKYSIPNEFTTLRESYDRDAKTTILYDVSGGERKSVFVDGFEDDPKFYTYNAATKQVLVVDDSTSFKLTYNVSSKNGFITYDETSETVPLNNSIEFWEHLYNSGGSLHFKNLESLSGYNSTYNFTMDMDDDGIWLNLKGIYLFDFNRAW